MIKQNKFGRLIQKARNHPHFLKIGMRVLWRNATNLIDYRFSNGWSFPPKAVTFRISGQCNLYCKMCNFRHSGFLDTSQILSLSVFKKVIDEVYPYKLWISFTGGEPLLHPNIIECLRYTKEKGLNCSLVTNGWHLTKYAKEIIGAGVDLLTVSIDGSEKIHDEIRGRKGLYKRIIEGIKVINKLENRPLFFFSTTIQANNYIHLEEVIENAITLGIDGVSIQHLQTRSPQATFFHNKNIPELRVRKGWIDKSLQDINISVLQKILDKARRKDILVNIFPVLSLEEQVSWYSNPMKLLPGEQIRCPWVMANVFSDGTMRTCDDIILGDLKEEGFWDIWNGEKMRNFRKIAKKYKTFPICATCCSLYRTYAI